MPTFQRWLMNARQMGWGWGCVANPERNQPDMCPRAALLAPHREDSDCVARDEAVEVTGGSALRVDLS